MKTSPFLFLLSSPASPLRPVPASRGGCSSGRSSPRPAQVLSTADAFRPYPKVADRGAWSLIPEAQRKAFVAEAERQIGVEWPSSRPHGSWTTCAMGTAGGTRGCSSRGAGSLPFSSWASSSRTGPLHRCRSRTACGSSARRATGVCPRTSAPRSGDRASPMSPSPRSISSRRRRARSSPGPTTWWANASTPVHPLVRERLAPRVDRRILTPNLERDDFWWMGFSPREVNNWNPWVNSNWLASVLLLERNPDRRVRAVRRIARSLDRFIDAYPDDGGCDEGRATGDERGPRSSSLSSCCTRRARGVSTSTASRSSARSASTSPGPTSRAEYYVNIGDAPAKVRPEPELVFATAGRWGDASLAGFGAFLAAHAGPTARTTSRATAASPRPPALWGRRTSRRHPRPSRSTARSGCPDLQMMAAREKPGSSQGLYVAAWGGHNAQSHNHNDVGNVVVYADGMAGPRRRRSGAVHVEDFQLRRYEI